MVRAGRVAVAGLVMAVLTSCASSVDGGLPREVASAPSSNSSVSVTISTDATKSSPPASVTTSTLSITPPTAPESTSGSLEDPLPVGDVELSGFEYSEMSGTSWHGFVFGLVEAGLGMFNSDPGECLVLLGEITPTEISSGSITSGFETPSVSLVVGGVLVDSEVGECDTDVVEAAGFDWLLNAEVTVGTTYPFFSEFFLPEGTTGEIEAIVVGNPYSEESLFYMPTILPEPPTP